MFSTSLTVTQVAMITMVVMMMAPVASAAPKGNSHKQSGSGGAAVETVTVELSREDLRAKPVRSLANVSISPWTYSMSTDPELVMQMMEAHCLLHGCLDSNGKEDNNLHSRPIHQQVLVLRRVPSTSGDNNNHYRLESRLVAVGCTCVRPHVQHQDLGQMSVLEAV